MKEPLSTLKMTEESEVEFDLASFNQAAVDASVKNSRIQDIALGKDIRYAYYVIR